MKVGVLALQGAFREHREALYALGAEVVDLRLPQHLAGIDSLVLPGGESTTIERLLDTSGLREPLAGLLVDGLPALATCAGLIILATEVRDGRADQHPMAIVDCVVRRNGYGRQRESFEAPLDVRGLQGGPFPGVFIRAPVIERAGPAVEVLAEHAGDPVLARQGAVVVATFHPELAGDVRLHQWFLNEVS